LGKQAIKPPEATNGTRNVAAFFPANVLYRNTVCY
jgi:hypothetical protein